MNLNLETWKYMPPIKNILYVYTVYTVIYTVCL